MSFSPASRDWTRISVPTKAQVTYTKGMMLYNDETDNVPVTTTTQNNLLGIALEDKDSSSATTDIAVLVPCSPASTFLGSATGTLTKAMEGDQFDFASGGADIAQAASTYDTVTLVKFRSASEGIFRFNVLHGKD